MDKVIEYITKGLTVLAGSGSVVAGVLWKKNRKKAKKALKALLPVGILGGAIWGLGVNKVVDWVSSLF